MVEIVLTRAADGQVVSRQLLADTGAGTAQDNLEIFLAEADCLSCGGSPGNPVLIGGAYIGTYPVYSLRIQVPALGFNEELLVVAASAGLEGLDGIATFPFLNRFSYGNFGAPNQFGLET
jgi:hypothetical protein